jgi:hypothetical protein
LARCRPWTVRLNRGKVSCSRVGVPFRNAPPAKRRGL